MTLADLRKLSVRKQVRVRFPLQNGQECVVTEHGVAKVPALRGVPDFNLERELANSREFLLEPVNPPGQKHPLPPRSIGREEMEKLVAAAPAGGHEEREEE